MDSFHENKQEIWEFVQINFIKPLLDLFNDTQEKTINFYNFTQQIVDIFIYCIKFHTFKFRQFILQNKLFQILYKGFEINEKSVDLAIIRIFKHTILLKDEALIKYLIKNKLFEPIMDVFFKNSKKKSLLNSATLEILEIIHKENFKKLIKYIVKFLNFFYCLGYF